MADFSASACYQFTLAQVVSILQADLSLPAVIGISGAQGSGKSTLARQLVQQFQQAGIAAAAVSLDDYYLSQAKRQHLAATEHPLLAQRGVPGTHDISRAIADARAVMQGHPVVLPQFDKALDEPVANLAPQSLDLLIVEGWCLGVQPQPAAQLQQPVNLLEAEADTDGRWRHYVNQQLAGDYCTLWQLLKPLIWLQAPDWASVCRWRAQQEQQLQQQRGMAMSGPALARFMLPFQRLTQAAWRQLPGRADIVLQLDSQQQLQLIKPASEAISPASC